MSRTRTEDQPHDRLTGLAGAAIEAIEAHPDYRSDRAIVLLFDDTSGKGGVGLHGYEDTTVAIVDLLVHLQAIFEANGQKLAIVPLETRGTG